MGAIPCYSDSGVDYRAHSFDGAVANAPGVYPHAQLYIASHGGDQSPSAGGPGEQSGCPLHDDVVPSDGVSLSCGQVRGPVRYFDAGGVVAVRLAFAEPKYDPPGGNMTLKAVFLVRFGASLDLMREDKVHYVTAIILQNAGRAVFVSA